MKKIGTWLSVFALVVGVVGLYGGTAQAQLPANPDVELDCGDSSSSFVCPSETGGSYTNDSISSPTVLNPVTASDTASDEVIDHVIGGAFYSDYSLLGNGVGDPQAAEMLEVNEAGNMLTARLREGLKFSDGSTVTTEDVRYWYYNVTWNPNLPNSSTDVFTCPSGQAYQLNVVNDRELTFGCPDSEAFRTFPGNATSLFVLSKAMALDYIESQGVATNEAIAPGANGVLDSSPAGDDQDMNGAGAVIVPGENGTLDTSPAGDDVVIEQAAQEFMGLGIDATKMVGLGPFTITELRTDAIARYERNPHFYQADSNGTQMPYLDELSLIIIPTQGQNLSLSNFLNGTTDAFSPRPQDLSVLLSRQSQGGFPLNEQINSGVPASGTTWATLNWQDSNRNIANAARNANVRKALSLAIDRVAMVNNVLLGIGTPQYGPATIPNEFFYGSDNTCADFVDAGLATSDTCSDGQWTVRSGLVLNVDTLPKPTTPAIVQHLECLTDYESCVATAQSLLDEAGVVDSNGDGIREVPADFGIYDNEGGPLQMQVVTNAGNTIRENYTQVLCDGWNRVGVGCQAGAISFPTLVNQLLTGDYTGSIVLGLTGGDPAGSINVVPCGTGLHLYHVGCDPNATEGPTAATDTEVSLENAWVQGFNASTVEDAKEGFDEWQRRFVDMEPYFHLALSNGLFAVRTDRICNDGRAVISNDDVKFRVDLEGQTECPR